MPKKSGKSPSKSIQYRNKIKSILEQQKKPNKDNLAKRSGLSPHTIRKLIGQAKSLIKSERKLSSVMNEPTGRGEKQSLFNANEDMHAKFSALEDAGLDPQFKQSIDEKLDYIYVDIYPIQESLRVLASAPTGFLYRLSAIFETTLVLTDKYKMILPKSGTKHLTYRAIGTFVEEQLNEIILEPVREITARVNETFNNQNVIKFIKVSAIIFQSKRKREKNDKE